MSADNATQAEAHAGPGAQDDRCGICNLPMRGVDVAVEHYGGCLNTYHKRCYDSWVQNGGEQSGGVICPAHGCGALLSNDDDVRGTVGDDNNINGDKNDVDFDFEAVYTIMESGLAKIQFVRDLWELESIAGSRVDPRGLGFGLDQTMARRLCRNRDERLVLSRMWRLVSPRFIRCFTVHKLPGSDTFFLVPWMYGRNRPQAPPRPTRRLKL